jgi:GT2 family glycosyltransferase
MKWMEKIQGQKGNSVPKVSIVVLNWNGLENTLECIESLSKINYPDYEIIVVDNGSLDGSAQALKDPRYKITLLENSENIGFSAGNNVGIHHALRLGTDYVFLINNDTVVDPDVLSILVDESKRDVRTGIIGPKIYNYYEPGKVWFAGASIDWKTGESLHLSHEEIDNGKLNSVIEVDRLTGCAMLIKRVVFEEIGLLDPDYFLYFEDVDFCVRARKAGYKNICVQYAKVWHKVSMSTRAKEGSPLHTYYHNRNRLIFLEKHGRVSIREHFKNMLRLFAGGRYKRMGIIDFYLKRFGKKALISQIS